MKVSKAKKSRDNVNKHPHSLNPGSVLFTKKFLYEFGKFNT